MIGYLKNISNTLTGEVYPIVKHVIAIYNKKAQVPAMKQAMVHLVHVSH